MSRSYDYLVVGAGFAGAVLAERIASQLGKQVVVVDKRPHIAGNAYDFYDDHGLLVHKYGPHIFHTSSNRVVAYLSQFTDWRPYEHRVRAYVNGQLLPIPINLETINRFYGLRLNVADMRAFLATQTEARPQIHTSEDYLLSHVGRPLYEAFFLNYTRKHWGLDPSKLDSAVAARIPVRFSMDERYFSDTFQAMPIEGYTVMFQRMLSHPNISVILETDYVEIAEELRGTTVIYTGCIDEYFGYCFGPLPYRSLRCHRETKMEQMFQSAPVINYPNDHEYTRISEFKQLTGQTHPMTTIMYEYPCSEGEPYYPIPRPENGILYKRYEALSTSNANVHFVGRLATYKYLNMDQVVAQSLHLFDRIASPE